MKRRDSSSTLFRWPLAMAAISLAGLLAALLGDGAADWASWLLLASLLAVIGVNWRRDPHI